MFDDDKNYSWHSRNPYYISKKTNSKCIICDESIQNGEEYIEDIIGNYVHWDCIDSKRDLLDLFDGQIMIMEDG